MLAGSLLVQVLLAHYGLASPVLQQPNTGQSPGSGYYIVKFKDGVSSEDVDQHISWIQNVTHTAGQDGPSFGLRHRFTLAFQGYSAVLADDTIAQIFKSPEIVSIDPIGESTPPTGFAQTGMIGSGYIPTGIKSQPADAAIHSNRLFTNDNVNLKDIVVEKPKGWNTIRLTHRKFDGGYRPGPFIHNGYRGKGTIVYVLDTGVNLQQTGFQGSDVTQPAVFVRDSTPEDLNGHGTMCAGVIAGHLTGLAPDAKLVSLKVANDENRSWADDVAKGIEYVVRDESVPNNMKVISLSQVNFSGTPLVNTAIEAAIDLGIHVVISAGNDNVDACSINPANVESAIKVGSINAWDALPIKGARPKEFTKRPRSPIGSVIPNAGGIKSSNLNLGELAMQQVEAQEAIDYAGFDTADPEGTNWGPCVTIFAPGIYVPTLSTHNISTAYHYWGWGTSIAAPQVAALIAARLSEVGPMKPAAMKKWLIQQATKGQMQGDIKGSPNLIAFSGVKLKAETSQADAGNGGTTEIIAARPPPAAKLPPGPASIPIQQPVDDLSAGPAAQTRGGEGQAVQSDSDQRRRKSTHRLGKSGHRSSTRPKPLDRNDNDEEGDGGRQGRSGHEGQSDSSDGPWWMSWLRSL